MEENRLVKYESRELEKVGNSIAITSKLLAKNNDLSTLVRIGSVKVPNVNFNALTGIFKITGMSIHEDPKIFFDPLLDWIKKYFINPQNNIRFKFQFEYINGMSKNRVLRLIKYAIHYANDNGIKCSIDWYYKIDNEDILELGEIYKELVDAPFNLIQQNE